MYKCRNCGHIFDEGEQKTRYDRHNDYYTEPISICPVCNSEDFEVCVYCRSCGAEHFKDELSQQAVCRECIEAYRADSNNIMTCYEIGNRAKVDTKLNSFIYDFFGDVESIERHLLEYIKGIEEFAKQDFSQYLKNTDDEIISEMILEERRQ